jgi:hypothetical protein
MVRRDEERVEPRSGKSLSSRCASLAGANPVPVGAEAPGSRSQPSGREPDGRAGRQEPARRRKPHSREQQRGPQHEVKLAASTEKQSGSRAAHVTAKATSGAQVSERAVGPGGVRSAARVEREARNTRDPSASPSSGQGAPHKPEAKSAAVQRESEGTVVPAMVAQNNATGGKGPCFGHARSEGKREGMAAKSGPNDPDARTCDVQVREPQRELWAGAERRDSLRHRTTKRMRHDARVCVRGRGDHLVVHAPSRRPSVSRVREIRTHGLKGGSALSPMNHRSSR